MSYAALVQNPSFRKVFGASFFIHLGTGVFSVAFPWFDTMLTRNPLLIGLVAMAPQLPWLLLALPAGVWTDRLDHRRTIVVANMGMALATLAIVVLAFRAQPGLTPVLVLTRIALLMGCVEVLRDNTAQTRLPDVVEPAELESANAALQASETLTAQFIGPPLAGAMMALAVLGPRARAEVQAFWPALRDGVGWLWRHPTLRRLGLVLGAYNFLSQLIWAVMVLYAQDALHLNAAGYGALLSALAAGGIAGGLAAPWLLARLGTR